MNGQYGQIVPLRVEVEILNVAGHVLVKCLVVKHV